MFQWKSRPTSPWQWLEMLWCCQKPESVSRAGFVRWNHIGSKHRTHVAAMTWRTNRTLKRFTGCDSRVESDWTLIPWGGVQTKRLFSGFILMMGTFLIPEIMYLHWGETLYCQQSWMHHLQSVQVYCRMLISYYILCSTYRKMKLQDIPNGKLRDFPGRERWKKREEEKIQSLSGLDTQHPIPFHADFKGREQQGIGLELKRGVHLCPNLFDFFSFYIIVNLASAFIHSNLPPGSTTAISYGRNYFLWNLSKLLRCGQWQRVQVITWLWCRLVRVFLV